jgi:hypothetical protein
LIGWVPGACRLALPCLPHAPPPPPPPPPTLFFLRREVRRALEIRTGERGELGRGNKGHRGSVQKRDGWMTAGARGGSRRRRYGGGGGCVHTRCRLVMGFPSLGWAVTSISQMGQTKLHFPFLGQCNWALIHFILIV